MDCRSLPSRRRVGRAPNHTAVYARHWRATGEVSPLPPPPCPAWRHEPAEPLCVASGSGTSVDQTRRRASQRSHARTRGSISHRPGRWHPVTVSTRARDGELASWARGSDAAAPNGHKAGGARCPARAQRNSGEGELSAVAPRVHEGYSPAGSPGPRLQRTKNGST
jgi:hypothetical protein